jgi:hypothetical protein
MNATHPLGQFLRTLPHSAAATFLALFPIVDPFGKTEAELRVYEVLP